MRIYFVRIASKFIGGGHARDEIFKQGPLCWILASAEQTIRLTGLAAKVEVFNLETGDWIRKEFKTKPPDWLSCPLSRRMVMSNEDFTQVVKPK